jgi:hypothetical protein
MRQRFLQAIFVLGALLGLNGPVRADLIYDLEFGNAGISMATGPYGSVLLHLESGVATLTFTANNGFRFGDGGFVDANFNMSGFTAFVSCIGNNGGGTNFTLGTCVSGGSGNVDGWGVFNQTTTNSDGFKDSAISAVLTVSGTWTDENDVLAANADGHVVAAHIFVCKAIDATGCDQKVDALATGFATDGNGTQHDVPEPQSLALLGLGLVGLAVVRRRRNA